MRLPQAKARCSSSSTPTVFCQQRAKAVSTHYMVFVHAAAGGSFCRPISLRPSRMARPSAADPTYARLPRASLVDAFAPGGANSFKSTFGTGVEPVTARFTVWCSTSELTVGDIVIVRIHVRNTSLQIRKDGSVRRWSKRHQTLLKRDAGGSRTHFKLLCRQPPCRLAPASVVSR
jgi:hypothetical protein